MTLWPLATAAAILLATAWVAHRALRTWLVAERATRLRAQAKPIVDRRLEHLEGQLDVADLAAILALDLTSRDTSAIVLGASGQVIAAAPREEGGPGVPEVARERLERALAGDPHVTWVVPGAEGHRLLVALVPPKAWLPDPPAIVALATDLHEDERLLGRLGLVLGAGVVLTGWLAVALELWAGGGALDLLALLAIPLVLLVARVAVRQESGPPRDRAPAAPAAAPSARADFTDAMRRVEAAFLAQHASEERMRRFVADASHELRTPLTSLSGAAEVLLRGAKDDPGHAERVARVIQTQASRMQRLIEDLLTLARLDAGAPLRRESVALNELAAEHAEELELADPGKTVRVEIEGGAVVDGDPGRLRQVLANLTANAARHTRRNGLVDISVTRVDGNVVLSVRDDGEGIDEEDLPRIFERFYRADAARGTEGSGLGLAIVQEIVQAHGGDVTAASAPGEGATFSVWLPGADSANDQQSRRAEDESTLTMEATPIREEAS